MPVITVTHPLVRHKIGLLREKDLSTKDFRALTNEVGRLLAYEATADFPLQPATLECWSGPVQVEQIAGKKVTIVPILRAGLGMLDGVTDPHNLGACLRVADGAGAHAVVAPKDHAVGLNATVAKVASGAAETVPYLMVTNLARTLGEMKERGIAVIGTAEDAPHTLYEAPLTRPLALVLGAEGPGMRQLTRKTCDELVRIPMAGAVESLNVSVAAGVCLFEARRQRLAAAPASVPASAAASASA